MKPAEATLTRLRGALILAAGLMAPNPAQIWLLTSAVIDHMPLADLLCGSGL